MKQIKLFVTLLAIISGLSLHAQKIGVNVKRDGIEFPNGSIQTNAHCIPTGSTTAVLDVFAQFSNGIDGDVTGYGLDDQVQILSIDTDAFRDINTTGAPGDSIHHRTIVITKDIDRTTPEILSFYKTNSKINEIIIRMFKSVSGSGTEYNRITLTNVKVLEHRQNVFYDDAISEFRAIEKYYLVYQTIKYEDIINGVSTTLDWGY